MKTKAEIKRKYRLKKAIKDILINHINESYFLTLTFNNEFLNKTTKDQRFKIIKDYLNNQTDRYILNCDYGKKNGREHYHALTIATDKFINFNLYKSKYGDIHITPMNFRKYQSIESKINYLLNHAIKDTTNGKIIYSKAKRPSHKNKDYKRYFVIDDRKTEKFYKNEFYELPEQEKKTIKQNQRKPNILNDLFFNKH